MIGFLKRTFKRKEKDDKRYVLWVTSFDGEGYSSMYYGWSSNKTYSYDETVKKARELEDRYYMIDIIEYENFIIRNK